MCVRDAYIDNTAVGRWSCSLDSNLYTTGASLLSLSLSLFVCVFVCAAGCVCACGCAPSPPSAGQCPPLACRPSEREREREREREGEGGGALAVLTARARTHARTDSAGPGPGTHAHTRRHGTEHAASPPLPPSHPTPPPSLPLCYPLRIFWCAATCTVRHAGLPLAYASSPTERSYWLRGPWAASLSLSLSVCLYSC